MKPVLAALALLFVGSCGHSPPTRFFTLDPVPPARPPLRHGLAPLQIGAVHIPATLDRPEFVTHSAANRLTLSERDQWAAPLAELIGNALARDLTARLPQGSVIPANAVAPSNARILTLDVLALSVSATGISFQARWSLLAPDKSRPLLSRDVTLTTSGGSATAAQATGLSRLVGELADSIAASLS